MARAYSLDLRERVVAAVAAGETLPGGGGDVRGQRRERGEVVAAVPRDRQCGGAADGRAAGPTCWRASGTGCWRGSPRSRI